jgi:hypothetical protein
LGGSGIGDDGLRPRLPVRAAGQLLLHLEGGSAPVAFRRPMPADILEVQHPKEPADSPPPGLSLCDGPSLLFVTPGIAVLRESAFGRRRHFRCRRRRRGKPRTRLVLGRHLEPAVERPAPSVPPLGGSVLRSNGASREESHRHSAQASMPGAAKRNCPAIAAGRLTAAFRQCPRGVSRSECAVASTSRNRLRSFRRSGSSPPRVPPVATARDAQAERLSAGRSSGHSERP